MFHLPLTAGPENVELKKSDKIKHRFIASRPFPTYAMDAASNSGIILEFPFF